MHRRLTLGLLLIALIACAERVQGLISNEAVAFCPVTGKTYVINAAQNEVLMFKAASPAPVRIAVGNGPVSMVVNRRTGEVYVAIAGEGLVAVIDGSRDKVVAKVPVGSHPYAMAIDSTLNRIYISRTFSDVVAMINGENREVKALHLGSADALAVDEQTHSLFLAGYEDPNLRILNEETGNMQNVVVGEHVWALAVNEQSGTVYLTRTGASELIAVDEHTLQKQIREVGAIPCALAVDSVAGRVFVVNYGDNTVSVLKTKGLTRLALAAVGPRPQAVAISSDGQAAYVASLNNGSLTRIDAETGVVTKTFTGGRYPYAIGLTAEGDRVLAADLQAGWSSFRIR